jgi:hypothetical protein
MKKKVFHRNLMQKRQLSRKLVTTMPIRTARCCLFATGGVGAILPLQQQPQGSEAVI